jgi:SRSO17 transposase
MLASAPGAASAAQRERLARHVLAQLVCLGSHTLTGVLTTCGRQGRDWSADYRMYARDRVRPEDLFATVRAHLCAQHTGPVVVALDDTRLRKTGKKTHGVKYMRDPLSPPFRVNFIRAQRFLQLSMASPGEHGQARMVPVDWVHAPLPAKPGSKATQAQQDEYKAQRKAACLSQLAVERLQHLRAWLNGHQAQTRTLWSTVDGSFSNKTVLAGLPENTTLVGRIRKDTKLYYRPEEQPLARGRRRRYGRRAPTPEELRQDDTKPWQEIEAFFGGQTRQLRAKRLGPVRWRVAGGERDLQVVVLAPTPYRLTQQSKLLYRQPAYLICTDPDAPIEQVVQHYLWRWDIEVNFRDQKTVLGLGEAQVRTPHAVQNVTAVAVAAYALLLCAAAHCQREATLTERLPPPKWQRHKSHRPTTAGLIRNLRHELWAGSIHFSSFATTKPQNTKPQKITPCLQSSLFYAARYT